METRGRSGRGWTAWTFQYLERWLVNMFSSRATVVLFNSGYILGWQLSACGAVFCKHVKKTIFYHFRKAKKKAKPQKTQKTMVQKHQKNVKHWKTQKTMVQKHQKMPNTEKHNFQGLPTLKKHFFWYFLNFCELPKKYVFLCLETMKNVFFDVLKPSNFEVSTCDFEDQNLGKIASPGKCIFCWFPGRPQRYPTLSVLIPDPN